MDHKPLHHPIALSNQLSTLSITPTIWPPSMQLGMNLGAHRSQGAKEYHPRNYQYRSIHIPKLYLTVLKALRDLKDLVNSWKIMGVKSGRILLSKNWIHSSSRSLRILDSDSYRHWIRKLKYQTVFLSGPLCQEHRRIPPFSTVYKSTHRSWINNSLNQSQSRIKSDWKHHSSLTSKKSIFPRTKSHNQNQINLIW